MPKLDVISGCGSSLNSDCFANDEGHGFGLGLGDLLRSQGATIAATQHFGASACASVENSSAGCLEAVQQTAAVIPGGIAPEPPALAAAA
jgi:hypothetical protein